MIRLVTAFALLLILASGLSAQEENAARGIDRLEVLYRQALKADGEEERSQALGTLLGYGSPALRFVLLTKLDTTDEDEVGLIERILLSDTSVSAQLIIERLAREQKPIPRMHLVRLLGQSGDSRARQSILAVLKTEDNPAVLSAAVRAIGLIGETADSAAIECYFNDEDERLRRQAIVSARLLRSPTALEPLLGQLIKGNFSTRFPAAEAVAAFGERAIAPLAATCDAMLGVETTDGESDLPSAPGPVLPTPILLPDGMSPEQVSRARGTLYLTLTLIAGYLDEITLSAGVAGDENAEISKSWNSKLDNLVGRLAVYHSLEPDWWNRRIILHGISSLEDPSYDAVAERLRNEETHPWAR